jgi:hypothetical protein
VKAIAMSPSTHVFLFAHRRLRPVFAALVAIPSLLGSSSCASAGNTTQGDDGGSDDATEQPDGIVDGSSDRSDSTSPPHDSGSSSGADTSTVEDGLSNQDGAGTDGAADDGSADAPPDVTRDSGAQDVAMSDAPCGGCGPRSVCVNGLCVGSQRVFVSSTVFTGDLGGSPGADSICRMLATGAGLNGTWLAWVADGTNPPPSMRFYRSTGPYRTLDGAVVALNFAHLTDSSMSLFNAIKIDETGASQASSSTVKVWTGTTAAGAAASQTCAGFTAGDASSLQAEVGNLGDTSSGNWDADGTENCSKQLHLYCFEQ